MIFKLNKERERKEYLQNMLDLIMDYSTRYPKLKNQFFPILYNVFMKGEIQILRQKDVKTRDLADKQISKKMDELNSTIVDQD